METSTSGSFVALAGLIVLGLSKIGVNTDTNTIVAVISGLVALYGIIKQYIAHKKLIQVATDAGIVNK